MRRTLFKRFTRVNNQILCGYGQILGLLTGSCNIAILFSVAHLLHLVFADVPHVVTQHRMGNLLFYFKTMAVMKQGNITNMIKPGMGKPECFGGFYGCEGYEMHKGM